MFFKKELCITRNMKQYSEITDRLSQNGIKYTVSTGTFASAGRYHGTPLVNNENVYEYRIFVSRKDYELAKSLL